MKTRPASALFLAFAAACTPAFANAAELVTNGTFEQYAGVTFSGFQVITAGSGALYGWVVGGSSVDVVNGGYGAVTGNSIDILGSPGPGSLSQTLATIAGQTYTLSFDLSQNMTGDNTRFAKDLLVSIGNASATVFTAVYSGAGTVAHETLSFTALSSSMLLSFSGVASAYSGAVLDNVSVTTAVPEPETYAMLLAGLGLLATIGRRRKNRAQAHDHSDRRSNQAVAGRALRRTAAPASACRTPD